MADTTRVKLRQKRPLLGDYPSPVTLPSPHGTPHHTPLGKPRTQLQLDFDMLAPFLILLLAYVLKDAHISPMP